MYLLLKHLHVTLVAISFLMFFIRGIFLFMNSTYLQKKWLKIAPHIINTLMLITGIAVAVDAGLSPVEQPWLLAKIIALIVFIGLGIAAFKRPSGFSGKVLWLSALIVFGYIIAVAITKNPLVALN